MKGNRFDFRAFGVDIVIGWPPALRDKIERTFKSNFLLDSILLDM
jgi:hypothetical protein